jgi:L-serine dehydratase
MTVSVFDLFSVGIGPSSSHTVGPIRAAARFADDLATQGLLGEVAAVRVDLYGSLAATGHGHGTLPAILFGLEGARPDQLDPDDMATRLAQMRSTGVIHLGGATAIPLTESDIALHPEIVLDRHPNGITLHADSRTGANVATETYFSVGGGFVVAANDPAHPVRTEGSATGVSFGSARGSDCTWHAKLTAQEAANGAGLRLDLIRAIESEEPATEDESTKIKELIVALGG